MAQSSSSHPFHSDYFDFMNKPFKMNRRELAVTMGFLAVIFVAIYIFVQARDIARSDEALVKKLKEVELAKLRNRRQAGSSNGVRRRNVPRK